MENYKYEINLCSSFVIDNQIISKIYLPILGKDAIFLYQFLRNEYDNNKNSIFEHNNNHQQLLNSNNVDWNKFVEIRKSLEAIKLISTYINKDTKTFTYVLNPPLTFQEFCNDEKLYSILKNRVTKQNLEEIKYSFSPFIQKGNMFEISESIDFLLTETEMQDFFLFDFDRLYKELISEYHTNFELTYELKSKIDTLFSNRTLNFNEIYQLVKSCIVDTTSGYLISINIFNERLNKLKNEKDEAELAKQIIINRNFEVFSSNEDLLKFDKIINDYKKYKTENYITSVLKENISFEIKSWINTLKFEYHFNDQMINVIVDYVIFKNNGALHKNYILKIAKTLSAKAINTIEGIINHFRQANQKVRILTNNENNNKPFTKIKNDYNNYNDVEKKLMASWR